MLLGEAWKSLPLEERESYSNKAKVLADEQKKIHPDCWKRKKTVASNNAGPNAGPQVNNNSNSALSSPLPLPAGLANFTLPTSLATPLPLRPPPPLQEVTAQSIKIEAPPTSTLDIVWFTNLQKIKDKKENHWRDKTKNYLKKFICLTIYWYQKKKMLFSVDNSSLFIHILRLRLGFVFLSFLSRTTKEPESRIQYLYCVISF